MLSSATTTHHPPSNNPYLAPWLHYLDSNNTTHPSEHHWAVWEPDLNAGDGQSCIRWHILSALYWQVTYSHLISWPPSTLTLPAARDPPTRSTNEIHRIHKQEKSMGNTNQIHQWETPIESTTGKPQWDPPMGNTNWMHQWETPIRTTNGKHQSDLPMGNTNQIH